MIASLLDRQTYDGCIGGGARDLCFRLNERAREILAEHTVPPLPEGVPGVITDVLDERREQSNSRNQIGG